MPFWGRVGLLRFKSWCMQSTRWRSRIYGVAAPTSCIAGGRRTAEKAQPLMPWGPLEQFAATRFYAAPVQVKPKKEEKESKGPRMNGAITSESVRLVTDEGHSIISLQEALNRAMELQLDLVEVEGKANPPVCKIMDYHREKYQKEITLKNRLKSKAQVLKSDCKEVRFTGKIEQKDLQIKAELTKRLMERGYRVKCMAKGTEQEDLGGLLSRLSALIEDVAFVESGPFVEKRQAYVVVRHTKFGMTKKGRKATTAAEGTSGEVRMPTNNVANPVQKTSWTQEVDTSENDLETEYDVLSDHEAGTDHVSSTFSDGTVVGGEDLAEIQKLITASKPIPKPEAEPAYGKIAIDKVVDRGDISSHSEPLSFMGENCNHQRGDLRTKFQDLKPNDRSIQVTGSKAQAQAYGFPQLERIDMNNRGPGRNQPLRPDYSSPNQRWEAQEAPDPGRNQSLRSDRPSPNQRWEAREAPNLGPGRNQPLRSDYSSPNQRWESREAPDLGPGRNQSLRPDRPSPNQRLEAREAPNLGPGRNQPLRRDGSSPNQRREAREAPNLDPGRNHPLRQDRPSSPNQRWEAREAPNPNPATEQKLSKRPPVGGNTKHDPSDAKQGQSVSSYGIFSAPRAAANGDQTGKSSNSGGIHQSQDPTKLKAENQRQDADEASQGKWGIFSR